MHQPRVGLVIFDCDGVLVDSEPIAMRVLLETIRRAGVEIAPEEGFRSYLGRSFASVARNLEDRFGLTLDDTVLEAMRRDLYEAYRAELRPMVGMLDVLPQITIPVCVASSSQMERIAISLDVTGLTRSLQAVFSASMVASGKPAPDLFLYAARQMHVDPSACVVIEDSPAGIVAAKKAGMQVFAFTGGGHIGPSGLYETIVALRPDAIFADMRDLPRLLEEATTTPPKTPQHFVAVDVGTGSARAGVFNATGTLLARTEVDIAMRRHTATIADHDSSQIWQSVCTAVRRALADSHTAPESVAGIGFDATCSLVIRSTDGPLGVTDSDDNWDTICWFDHRALAEADRITRLGHPAVRSVGDVVSPEMQLPKMIWLKTRRPQTWSRMAAAYDLVDFLTYRATGSNARSLCTLTTKWNWAAGGWADDLLLPLDLADLQTRSGIAEPPMRPGDCIGPLTERAAGELGLTTSCSVAAGLVDAHAGALGAIAADVGNIDALDPVPVLVAGTSSSFLMLTRERRQITGVWGPFPEAVLAQTDLIEAGQSASGALLDAVLANHPAGGTADDLQGRVLARISQLRDVEGWQLGEGLHIVPDFNGNRSPDSDPRPRGAIIGLSLDADFDSLCRLYFRTAIALALSLRNILDHLRRHGFRTSPIAVAGGHTRNALLMEIYNNVLGAPLRTWDADVTLLGTAMLAAHAAGTYTTMAAAGMAMAQPFREIAASAYYEGLVRDEMVFRELMEIVRRT